MTTTFLELTEQPVEIIHALDRNERIILLYGGRAQAVVGPVAEKGRPQKRAEQHPAFGLWQDRNDSWDTSEQVRGMRLRRFHDL